MNLYKPSELKAFLLKSDKKANKHLSQNFLIDKNILNKIIKLSEPSAKNFPILEIGPGPGSLTEELLRHGFKVYAVELDESFAKLLIERLKPFFLELTVIRQDFLLLDLNILSKESCRWSVIANLPYHITTKALIKLLLHAELFTSLTLMVQYEFFQRIQALSGKDYGIINILTRICSPSIEGFKVSAQCFYPAPRVESAVLHLKLQKPHTNQTLNAFYAFLKAGFAARRKKLISNLKVLYSNEDLRQAFSLCRIDLNARVEALSPEGYLELFTTLAPSSM